MRRNLYLQVKEVRLFEIQVVKLEETCFYQHRSILTLDLPRVDKCTNKILNNIKNDFFFLINFILISK